MPQSINLIPEKEIKLQKEKKLINFSTVFTLISLVITIIIALVFFSLNRNINTELQASNNQLLNVREEIASKENLEVSIRNLEKKYNVLSGILNETPKYSILLNQLYKRKPVGIELYDMSLRSSNANTIEISGKSDTYLLVSQFLSNITDTSLDNIDLEYLNLFTNANLNNVSLESDGSPFSITITFDNKILMENY